ncbi:MAG: CmcI family methyltransferase [Verrucomicrobiales bacterium]|jgi:cephalosporin hydroxylase
MLRNIITKCGGKRIYDRLIAPVVSRLFLEQLIRKTGNFGSTTWLGYPIWQNTLDLWTIQETLAEIKPALLIECGTNRGGSARYYSHLFDLMGHGEIVSIDVEKLHELQLPRVQFLLGTSVDDTIVATVRERVARCGGPVMVILDSDHSEAHVARELEIYSAFVTPGSYLMVQDGVIDIVNSFQKQGRPGPLPAIRKFLAQHSEFALDQERCDRFMVTHHPMGWLKRR